ncbi:SRPBCC domain-containing protein [Sporosarcina sp. 179-K 3D1 HS]|uniref:SRPBCC family protein n=1 Tax=Sporosarcina sp. 179-K 3D1 HS TaxID=3232169 RepID=UPI0039A0C594
MQSKEILPDIRKTIVLDAPIETVWKAVATSEGLAGWWMPNTFEPVVGQSFILRAGGFGDSPCVVKEIVPLQRIAFDWAKDWHLTFELQEDATGKTEFSLIHSGWDANKVTEFGQPHTQIREHMAGGWEKIIHQSLPAYLK